MLLTDNAEVKLGNVFCFFFVIFFVRPWYFDLDNFNEMNLEIFIGIIDLSYKLKYYFEKS